MKRNITLVVFAFAMLFGTSVFAQMRKPAPSPASSASSTFGVTKVSVDYSSPGVKGRKIFGELLPFDKIWRAGANAATQITFEDDVKISGKDVLNGIGLWQLNGVAFIANDSKTITVQENQTGKIIQLDLKSGESIAQPTTFNTSTTTLQLPSSYLHDSSYFQTVASFLENKLGYRPVMSIDYLETPKHIIISFYEQEHILHNQKLLILNRQGKLISEETLNTELKGTGTETFMLWQKKLIYVQEKQRLFMVDLER